MSRADRIDEGFLDRAQETSHRVREDPVHADQAQHMADGIRQIRAGGGWVHTLPDGSAGAQAGAFLGTVQASSVGSDRVRAAQNLDTDETRRNQLVEVYRRHYRSLLGLAALLLDDAASCEDVVQEAFIRMHSAAGRIRDPDKTLAYLRQTVVNLSRSALRHRELSRRLLSKPMPDMASAEEGAYEILEREQLRDALSGLPRRQREVLVLRYFAGLSETQIADTLGISQGAVRAYASRGLATLRSVMELAATD